MGVVEIRNALVEISNVMVSHFSFSRKWEFGAGPWHGLHDLKRPGTS